MEDDPGRNIVSRLIVWAITHLHILFVVGIIGFLIIQAVTYLPGMINVTNEAKKLTDNYTVIAGRIGYETSYLFKKEGELCLASFKPGVWKEPECIPMVVPPEGMTALEATTIQLAGDYLAEQFAPNLGKLEVDQ